MGFCEVHIWVGLLQCDLTEPEQGWGPLFKMFLKNHYTRHNELCLIIHTGQVKREVGWIFRVDRSCRLTTQM